MEFDLSCNYEPFVPATHWQPESGGNIFDITVEFEKNDVTHVFEMDKEMFEKVCESLRCSES